jgi:hypothetical protein
MHGTIHPLPQYTLMARCSVKKKEHRDNFTFTVYLLDVKENIVQKI